jgi:hypothetical protein
MPPNLVPATGRPDAIASKTTVGKGSGRIEGTINKSICLEIS